MMQQFFAELAANLEAKLRESRQETVARRLYTLEVARLGLRLYAREAPLAWCGVLTPFDLLQALGVNSCFVEFVGAMLASFGAVEPLLELAEHQGFATDICSYHRAINGAARQGLMPRPDFLVATTCPCSGGLSTIENLAHLFQRDMFVIHIPQESNPASVQYLARQYRELTEFVTAHTHAPLDPERLRRTMVNTNRTRALLVEIYDLARRVPTPARRNDLVNFGFIMNLLLGTDHAVQLAEAYRDEFARKVAAGTAGVPGERMRLLWYQNRIQFKNPLEKIIEEEFQAAVVIDELNVINWAPIDPDDPYEGLAARTLANPLSGAVDRRIANLLDLARSYQVDGMINPCHWGCRQGTGARGLVETALKKEGFPVLNLEVDCIDPRNFSEGQMRTRLQAFIEMILARQAHAPRGGE